MIPINPPPAQGNNHHGAWKSPRGRPRRGRRVSTIGQVCQSRQRVERNSFRFFVPSEREMRSSYGNGMNSVLHKSEQPSHRHDGDARAVVVDPIECVRQSTFGFGSVPRARGQEQATVLRNVDRIAADFGGWRSFFTANRRLGQLGGNRRDRRGGPGSLEGVLASPVDLRSRIGGRRVALTRRRDSGLARRSNTVAGRVRRATICCAWPTTVGDRDSCASSSAPTHSSSCS